MLLLGRKIKGWNPGPGFEALEHVHCHGYEAACVTSFARERREITLMWEGLL
jgi:hypothetical protein